MSNTKRNRTEKQSDGGLLTDGLPEYIRKRPEHRAHRHRAIGLWPLLAILVPGYYTWNRDISTVIGFTLCFAIRATRFRGVSKS